MESATCGPSILAPLAGLAPTSRALAVEADGAQDPRIDAALRARFGAGARIRRSPRARTCAHDEGEREATVHGSWIAIPGTHRLRAVQTDRGVMELRLPLSGRGEDAPLSLMARRGVVVLFDVDRDLVGSHVPQEGWEGRETEIVVSSLPLSRPFASSGRRSLVRDALVRHAGGGALLYVLGLALLSLAIWSAVPFVLGISYVHYFLYLATLESTALPSFAPGRIAFRELVRDALFFKTLSMLTLGVLAVVHLTAVSPLSMLLVGIGVALSMWAARTLGFERTYFAVELGILPPSRVASGPYGLVPHPMITGAVLALLGAYVSPGLAEAWPWLVPGHVALYLAHLAQEVRLARATRTARAG